MPKNPQLFEALPAAQEQASKPSRKEISMPDVISLRELFGQEEANLIRYAWGIISQREAAEDVVQEAFLRLHQHWAEVENPRGWIYRCVHNLALNHLRSTSRETELTEKSDVSTSSTPSSDLVNMETLGSLRMFITELDPTDQKIITLKYLHDMKYEEIATHTRLSVGNVGYRLHHILKALAESLRNIGITQSNPL